jgi:ATP-binding cassette, subfamily B, bacterial
MPARVLAGPARARRRQRNGGTRSLWSFRSYARPHAAALAAGVGLRIGELLADLAQPWPLAVVIDSVLGTKPLSGFLKVPLGPFTGTPVMLLTAAAAASLVLAFASAAFDYLGDRVMNGAGERITAAIRTDLFAHLHRLPLTFHDAHSVGELASRVSADTDRIDDGLVDMFSTVVPGILSVSGLLAMMLAVNWRLGLIGLASAPILAITISRYTRLTRQAARSRRAKESGLMGTVAETLVGIRAVHALGRHDVHDRRFAAANSQTLAAGLRAVDVRARFTPIVEVGAAVGATALLWVGAFGVLHRAWTLGLLIVEVAYVGNLLKPIRSLSRLSLTLSTGAASAERVRAVLDEHPAQHCHDLPMLTPRTPHAAGAVELRGVHFGYRDQPVLRNVTLAIAPGQRVALMGANGTGKSTLLALLARLYDPDRGSVLLDGQPIHQLPIGWLRDQIAIVLQDTFLFSGTLWDNIAYGNPTASREEIVAAADLAMVTEFARTLPTGFHTPLGDSGTGLSGGQRQRVAIARALLRDAPIVLLDEPTSALDLQAEHVVINALRPLVQNRTVVMATHRPALLALADRILQADGGTITEQLAYEHHSTGEPSDAALEEPTDQRRSRPQWAAGSPVRRGTADLGDRSAGLVAWHARRPDDPRQPWPTRTVR